MFLNTLAKSFINRAGWHSNSKYLVFVSDDWGSVRNFSINSRQNLIAGGFDMNANRFDKYDILESDTDIARLFDVLLDVKNINDEHPVITAAMNVANPDFEKIRLSGFGEYYYETIDKTYSATDKSSRVLDYFNLGIKQRIFRPEFHGREHLDYRPWIRALKQNRQREMAGFKNRYWFMNDSENYKKSYGAAFDISSDSDTFIKENVILDGIKIFKNLFGYFPQYFTPPEGIYNIGLENVISTNGIRMIDVPLLQKMPIGGNKFRFKVHYSGQRSPHGIRYVVRNVVFEPNLYGKEKSVDVCLDGIERCFRNNLPVIISNHRAAFVGGIHELNRDEGLYAIKKLFTSIVKLWPEVNFITMSDLYELFD
jgi:hypothetical protein